VTLVGLLWTRPRPSCSGLTKINPSTEGKGMVTTAGPGVNTRRCRVPAPKPPSSRWTRGLQETGDKRTGGPLIVRLLTPSTTLRQTRQILSRPWSALGVPGRVSSDSVACTAGNAVLLRSVTRTRAGPSRPKDRSSSEASTVNRALAFSGARSNGRTDSTKYARPGIAREHRPEQVSAVTAPRCVLGTFVAPYRWRYPS